MRVAVVDYGSGNLQSVRQALAAASATAGLDADVLVTGEPDGVAGADRVVLPGVGAFGDCMAGISGIDGMREALAAAAGPDARPFLGICVGMQLMGTEGLEGGRFAGFDWIGGVVGALEPADPSLKIPHMGWNGLEIAGGHPVLDGVGGGAAAYFLHSFAFTPADGGGNAVLARADYGGPVVAAIGRGNLVGLQFHPEKSQSVGQRILANWLEWKP